MSIYNCKLCEKNIKNSQLLGRHLHYFHKEIDKESYYRQYINNDNKCIICNSPTRFLNLSRGYNKTCSQKCATKLQWQNDVSRAVNQSLRWKLNNPVIPGIRKGTKNKNPYPMTDAVNKRLELNPPPSWLGKKHTLDTRIKMSETRIDKIESGEIKIVAGYKGKFQPKNVAKYKGDPTNIIYRSLWELKCMMKFDSHPDVLEWSSEEITIPYISPIDNRRHLYFPDFFMRRRDKDGKTKSFLIEVKPKAQTVPPKVQTKATKRYINEVATWGVNSAKWKMAEQYCADRGWEFIKITEDDLGLTF